MINPIGKFRKFKFLLHAGISSNTFRARIKQGQTHYLYSASLHPWRAPVLPTVPWPLPSRSPVSPAQTMAMRHGWHGGRTHQTPPMSPSEPDHLDTSHRARTLLQHAADHRPFPVPPSLFRRRSCGRWPRRAPSAAVTLRHRLPSSLRRAPPPCCSQPPPRWVLSVSRRRTSPIPIRVCNPDRRAPPVRPPSFLFLFPARTQDPPPPRLGRPSSVYPGLLVVPRAARYQSY
jgi:hypothetical protein